MSFGDYVVRGAVMVGFVFLCSMFVLVAIGDASETKAIERMGCDDVETVFDEKACQIGDQIYFVDVDCNSWGLDCKAQIVTIGQFTTTPRGE